MNPSVFDIRNKVAVITGATGVLGGAISDYLVTVGVKVVVLGTKTDKVKAKVDDLIKLRGDAIGFAASVLDEEEMKKIRRIILEKWNTVDILINAAGGNMPGATIGEDQTFFDLKMEDFDAVSKLNLNGTVIPSLVFGEIMARKKKGVIINYSSMAVDRAITRVVGYSASKAALENFTKWLAVEMALKFGETIRVNAIAPGFFIGNQNKTLLLHEDGSLTSRGQKIIANTPMGRFGTADELNGIIHYLCSDASAFVTGAVIPVDGGFSAFSGV